MITGFWSPNKTAPPDTNDYPGCSLLTNSAKCTAWSRASMSPDTAVLPCILAMNFEASPALSLGACQPLRLERSSIFFSFSALSHGTVAWVRSIHGKGQFIRLLQLYGPAPLLAGTWIKTGEQVGCWFHQRGFPKVLTPTKGISLGLVWK